MLAWLRRPSSLLVLIAVAVTASGAFGLAWVVSRPAAPIVSVSYAVGYDNAVAWAAVLVGCGIAWAAGRRRRREDGDEDGGASGFADASETTSEPVPRPDVIVLAALTGLASLAFAAATFGIPMFDSIFFFDRMAQALAGWLPWRDFGFPYGPVMLYVPVAIGWVAQRLGASPALGYYVALTSAQVAGVPMLSWALGPVPLSRARKRAVFWAIGGCALLSVTGGLNYTLVRFLAPVVGLIVLARLMRREPAPHAAVVGAASVAIAGLVAALSAEMAVAYVVASTAMLLSWRRSPGSGGATAALVQLAAVAAAAIALGGAVVGGLAAFASGAYAFPILPSPFVLTYMATALLVAHAAGSGGLGRGEGLPAAAIGLAGIVLVPSALGRADFGHAFWNGVPLFIAGAAALARADGRRFWTWAVALLLAFTAWTAYYDVRTAPDVVMAAARADVIPREATKALVRAIAPGRVSALEAAYGPDPGLGAWTTRADLERLSRLEDVVMPLGVVDTAGLTIAGAGHLLPFDADEKGPIDTRMLASVTEDLDRADRVVMPLSAIPRIEADVEMAATPPADLPAFAGAQSVVLLQFPARIETRRRQYTGLAELGLRIDEGFEYEETIGRYAVLRRRR